MYIQGEKVNNYKCFYKNILREKMLIFDNPVINFKNFYNITTKINILFI